MLSIPIIRDRIYVGQMRCCPGFIFTSHKYLLSYPILRKKKQEWGRHKHSIAMGCRIPIRQMPSGILSLTTDLEPGEI